MTRVTHITPERTVTLDSKRDWAELMDAARQYFHGDMPASDPAFDAAMEIQRAALKAQK